MNWFADWFACFLRTARRPVLGRTLGVAVFLLGTLAVPASAQELDCSVSLDYSQLSGSDFGYLDDLERRMREYLNTYSWTDDRFLDHERIACSFQVILQEAEGLSQFRARLIVATKRPIYGTSQSTPVVRINDPEWRFEYSRGAPLVHNLEQFDPLVSVLDFYAYIVLGYDYDTFDELGGTPHFERARQIAERARSSGGSNWAALGTERGRLDLVSELLDPRYRPFRQAMFAYHLEGLDRFVSNTEKARQNVLDALQKIQSVSQTVSRGYALDVFFSAKYQELTALFRNASMSGRAYNLLTQMDPSHSSEYNRLVN
jgi:hypothetical protein